jgi:energy-coupling factor transport system ATP-binding protein
MLRPRVGRISLDGCDIAGLDLFDIGRCVGCVFENPSRQMFCSTVADEIAFGLAETGLSSSEILAITDECLARLQVARLRDQYPGHLSRGEKQSVMLATMIARGTDYLVLDEPTTGLDIRTRHDLGRTLQALCREKNCGVVVVSHERDFINRYASREVICG